MNNSSKDKYPINIIGNDKDLPALSVTFSRINVILGGNGTGKSKILNQLKQHVNNFGVLRPLVFVEGGRAIVIPNTLTLANHNEFNTYASYEQTYNAHKGKRQDLLSQRLRDALILLEQTEREIKTKHSDATHKWHSEGCKTSFPLREKPPLEKLFELFNLIRVRFPAACCAFFGMCVGGCFIPRQLAARYLILDFDAKSKTLKCNKNGSPYYPSQLSDGEKQIFCLLADIVLLAEPNSLILVDEPELNLNPGLACRFWDMVESVLPEAVFIYTTHCVSFAKRSNVDCIVVLGKNAANNTIIENINEIDPYQLTELLGTIPAILSASSALAVEGKENSFDQLFYRWLLGKKDIEIVPMGGCEDVADVSNKNGIWKRLAPTVKIAGVIDSDYRHKDELAQYDKGSTHVLEYHEVESYFCNPKLVAEVGSKLSIADKIPTEGEITKLIMDSFEEKINWIAAQRSFARGKIRLAVSVSNSILNSITNEEDLKRVVAEEAEKETAKAVDYIGKDKMMGILTEELNRCKKAFEDGSIEEILKLLPGKELLNKLAPMVGCRSDRNFVRAVEAHIDISKYPDLVALKMKIDLLLNPISVNKVVDKEVANKPAVEA